MAGGAVPSARTVTISIGNGLANPLYRAQPAFFSNPPWEGLADWADALQPHYDTAERMRSRRR